MNFQDAIRESYDETTRSLKTKIVGGVVSLSVGDVEIGAVELKDGTSDQRATVNSGGELLVTIPSGATISTQSLPYSYYAQSSLVSGYVYHGFGAPGSNPTTVNFKIMRETLNTGEMLFGGGAATFVHTWSAASLASLSYL